MQYYKDENTNEVYAYEQADIDTVNSITSIENTLSKAQDAMDAITEPPEFVPEYDEEGNQTNADEYKIEREEYERAKQAVADAEEVLAGIDEVFFNIRENLKHCTLMTDEEVSAHLAPPKIDPLIAIATRRYEAETSGTTVEGMPVNTERDSQALLTGAALQAVLDPNYTVRWKTEGGFVDLGAQQIIDLASAVRAHVQACFDREAELVAAVEDGSYTDSMIDEGWSQGE